MYMLLGCTLPVSALLALGAKTVTVTQNTCMLWIWKIHYVICLADHYHLIAATYTWNHVHSHNNTYIHTVLYYMSCTHVLLKYKEHVSLGTFSSDFCFWRRGLQWLLTRLWSWLLWWHSCALLNVWSTRKQRWNDRGAPCGVSSGWSLLPWIWRQRGTRRCERGCKLGKVAQGPSRWTTDHQSCSRHRWRHLVPWAAPSRKIILCRRDRLRLMVFNLVENNAEFNWRLNSFYIRSTSHAMAKSFLQD